MDQLIPDLVELVVPLRDCFRSEVFQTFQILLAGWIVCNGPHTISGVWQATGLAAKRHHDTAYAVFHSAAWEWDDLGIVLATVILARLIPGGAVWIVVDDTLCHKRGPRSPSAASSSIRSLVEAAQDLPLRPQLRRAGHRRADPDADRSLLVPVGALADLPQKGSPAIRPAPRPPRRWPASWPRPPRTGPSGWSAIPPTSTRRCCEAARRTWR